MDKNNEKKSRQLGMPIGTASNRLRKSVLFSLLKELNQNVCFQCKKEIVSEEDMSIEHKVPWLDSENPKELFFSLDNIAFSHLNCNIGASRKSPPALIHGTTVMYNTHACRCNKCREKVKLVKRQYRSRIKLDA